MRNLCGVLRDLKPLMIRISNFNRCQWEVVEEVEEKRPILRYHNAALRTP